MSGAPFTYSWTDTPEEKEIRANSPNIGAPSLHGWLNTSKSSTMTLRGSRVKVRVTNTEDD
ncbi:hypothetical protein K0M31_011818 [Melipona bicolor]|uniref:Uncharacterized protein n=1 Tax=Melipona bicolor TaxID=60889 RepID=A0AA40KV41_9HYME|nr:hypothetical protein K0M31_011818 [Melipona bicolor]